MESQLYMYTDVHKEKDDKLKSSYYADFMRTQVSGFRKTN